MWLQQAESISQEVGDILDKAERRGIRCITNHTNDISDDVYKEIVKVDPEDWDYAKMRAMGWTLLVVAIVAA